MQVLLSGKIRVTEMGTLSPDAIKKRVADIQQGIVPEGYQKTKLGIIPEEWNVKRIRELANVTAGGTPSTRRKEYWNGDIRWMNSGEIHLKRINEVNGRITQQGLQNSSTKIIPPKSILIALAGQGRTRGTVAINNVKLCTNQSVAAIMPDKAIISYEFLFYYLDNRYVELRQMSAGDGGRGGLNLNILNHINIILPPFAEQQKISEILTSADKEIELLETELAQMQEQKKGLMQLLLSGKVRVTEVQRGKRTRSDNGGERPSGTGIRFVPDSHQ